MEEEHDRWTPSKEEVASLEKYLDEGGRALLAEFRALLDRAEALGKDPASDPDLDVLDLMKEIIYSNEMSKEMQLGILKNMVFIGNVAPARRAPARKEYVSPPLSKEAFSLAAKELGEVAQGVLREFRALLKRTRSWEMEVKEDVLGAHLVPTYKHLIRFREEDGDPRKSPWEHRRERLVEEEKTRQRKEAMMAQMWAIRKAYELYSAAPAGSAEQAFHVNIIKPCYTILNRLLFRYQSILKDEEVANEFTAVYALVQPLFKKDGDDDEW